jgi:sulfofructose kinase
MPGQTGDGSLREPSAGYRLRFARAAAAHKIRHLGNEAGLPTLAEIEAMRRKFGERP